MFGTQQKFFITIISLFLLAFFLSCHSVSVDDKGEVVTEKKVFDHAETKKMIDRIAEIYSHLDPSNYPSMNSQRAELLREKLNKPGKKSVMLNTYFAYCDEILNSGKTTESISELLHLEELEGVTADNFTVSTKPLFDKLALAYMRQGEQDNCIANHSGESCIVPIQGTGIHQNKTGSRKAIELYKKILAKFPDDYTSIWLMNVAYMTLGEYPENVPPQFLVPVSKSNPDLKIPKFKNIAGELGIALDGHAGGCCVEDFNNDGFLDIMSSSWSLTDQMHFLINNGDGTYTDKTDEAGLTGVTGGLNMIHADYNNDGFADVLLLRGAWRQGFEGEIPHSLLKNNGDGTFTEAAYSSGIYSEHPTQTAGWADFNLDGWLDLFIGNESTPGTENEPCELYVNNGNGTFTNMAGKFGMAKAGFVKGCSWGDVNNDGLPDLYLSVLNGNNKLYINRGGTTNENWKFEEVAVKAGVQKPFDSFPCWFWDYDNDGYQDLFVSGYDMDRLDLLGEDEARALLGLKPIAELSCLYHNNGNETFTDVARSSGFNRPVYAMGANFEDINNDGYLDCYLSTGAPNFNSIVPNRMFLNIEGKSFTDVTTDGCFGIIQKGHAVGFGDMDNDGDQDIYNDIGGANEGDNFRNAYFDNPGGMGNWVVLQLKGKTANRCAIGAKVHLTITENGKQRNIFRTIGTGGSFGSSSLQLELGIGSAIVIDKIEITWPNKQQTKQEFTNVTSGKKYLLEEGGQLQELPYKKIEWKLKTPSHDMSNMKM